MSSNNDEHYITYNSLISLCILSEDYYKSQFAKFLHSEENLEHSLYFKLCKKTFLDYSDIKGSLFYIRNIDECAPSENISKELGFLTKEKIHKNTNFYLQHMTSKKFVSVEKTIDNKYKLILMKNVNKAANFYLRKVNQKRNSQEFMNINDIFNLSVYIEDEDLFYFLKDGFTPIENNSLNYEIIIEKNPTTNLYIMNQKWYIRETKEIYSGQLINIIFSAFDKENKKVDMMLSVVNNEDKNKKEKESEKEDEKENNKHKYDEFLITGKPYTDKLSFHVLYNSFWVIEEDNACIEENIKTPIPIKQNFRIKNLNTNLYLNIRLKGKNESEESSDFTKSGEISNKLYEFYLVDENMLNENVMFTYNFLFCNYSFDCLETKIVDNGEYILKGVYKKFKVNKLYLCQDYYRPISLTMNAKNRLDIKPEDDYIFKIKKVELHIGIQVTYVQKIIEALQKVVEENDIKNDSLINESIKFFYEYLMNIDYSFRDEKYECNIPIKDRQILLLRFHVVELINKCLEYYLNKIEKEKKNYLNDKRKKILSELLNNIIKFYKNLSVDNEEIKQTIYIISLNKLLKLSDIIFCDNITDIASLLNFIFNLIDDSSALQDYFLGGGAILNKKKLSNENLKEYKIDDLLRENKIFGYIEKNHNYLLYYEKLIRLNKIQYKRKEIETDVRFHIESLKEKDDKKAKTYKQIIEYIISSLMKKIKKHAFLLDKFIQIKRNQKLNPSIKKKQTRSLFRKISVKLNDDVAMKQKQEIEEFKRRVKKKRTTTKESSNIFITDVEKMDTTNKLIDSEEENENDDNNIITNDFNKEEKEKESDLIKEKEIEKEKNDEDNLDRKDTNIKLKKTFTIGDIFKKKLLKSAKVSENNNTENSELNRIKSEFVQPDEPQQKVDKTKVFSSFLSSIMKTRKNFNKKEKDNSSSNLTRRNSVLPENVLPYETYVNKLGEILEFIKFFSSLDLNKGLFIYEHFQELIEEDIKRGGNLDNALYIFFSGNDFEKGKNCFLDKNIVNLYVLYLYNMLFPNIKSNLKEKIENNNLNGKDIYEELKGVEFDEKSYSNYDDENNYVKEMIGDFDEMDDDLCILYSIYQFLINQFIKTIYKLFELKCNFFLNYLSDDDLKKSKDIFSDIIKNLLSKITFLNKSILPNLYNKFKSSPSLLNPDFDLNSYMQNNNNNNNSNNLRVSLRNNKKNKIEKFTRREAMLIEYIYFFLKKCDEIKYIYEKMIVYKYIKYLIDYEKYFNEKSESLKEQFIKEQLSKISQKINNQKLKILNFYEKLVNSNKKHSINNNNQREERDEEAKEEEKDKFMAVKIKEKSEFITQLLRNYEIKKFFNNIIYMESRNSNIISDKALKKLKRIRGYIEDIEKEILMIKINYKKKYKDEDFVKNEINSISLKIINKYLGKICNEQGKLFHLDFISKINENKKLINMLIQENKSFYKKIKFTKIFYRMVKSIKYYKNFEDKNLLIYCSYLLKIFKDLKNNNTDLHRNMVKCPKLYKKLIFGSIACINCFSKNKITDEEPMFLNISYLAIEAFMIFLKNSKLEFKNMKEFMESFFYELSKVFNKFQNRKYKIIHQILYTFAVSRVLLFLNKQRNYSLHSYDVLFKRIYPIDKMRENIAFCFKTINNSLDKEHILSLRNSEIFIESNSNINGDENEENFSQYMQDDDKEGLIMNDFADKIIPMDLSHVHQPTRKPSIHESHHSSKHIENEQNISVDYIRWEDENEINRLSFYLNYLSVYVIYLNDKNTLMKDNKDDFRKKEKKESANFSFNALSDKIKKLFENGKSYDELIKKENLESNNLMITQLENSIIKEEKNFFGENLNTKNIDYKFFSVLLESILVYRANLNGQNIEIQIKKIKEKIEEEKNLDEDDENEPLKKNEESFINKNDNNNIIFYYYDPEYIDIILLEKILNEIELKEDLINYCLEDFHPERTNSNFLNELFKDQKAYQIIQTYYEEEYNLIHNYFIKNTMELLITNILRSYNSNDFTKITEMENYLYKRMGEIYSNTKINNETLLKKNSLVDFLIINEQNIRTDLKDINLLSFFDSLVYIYQKFRKPICVIYYKIGFELLIDKCFSLFKVEDDKENNSTNKFDLESITNILMLLFSSTNNREIIEDKKVFPIMLSSIETLLLYILSEGNDFIYKNIELLKEYFNKLNFIFEDLSTEFEKIVDFMKKPSKTKDVNKFTKKVIKLQNILDFLLIFLEYKKLNEEILTEEISKFTGKVIENVIKLLYILLELPNRTNFVAIDLLIEFLFNFIKGPDIDDLNLLFSLGFLDLVVYVIRDIDYYNIFLNYLNKDNLYEVIDYYASAECKILKIFIIYYNVSHGKNNIDQFEKLQHWYEDNFDLIKKKLKRLYYMSKKEMDKKEYNVDKMLLFFNKEDEYSEYELGRREGISDSKKNKYEEYINKMIKMDKYKNIADNITSEKENNKYCIIKFDLLLVYYSLYNYHIDLSTKSTELNISKKNIFLRFILFIFNILLLIFRIITIEFYVIYFIIKKLSIKNKTDVDLLQDLKNIETESQMLDDQQIIDFLKIYIKELELSLKNIIYKVYFPMLNKANTIEKYKDEYYKVEQIDSSDFINYLLSNYDLIHIRAKEYVLINKIINLPILNVFFKNLDTLANVLIIFSLISNLIIMLSYNNYIESCDDDDNLRIRRKKNYVRLNCPYLLYEKKYKSSVVIEILKIFGIAELILQTIIFVDYIVRIFSVEQAKIKLKYRTKDLRKKSQKKEVSNSKLNLIFISLEVLYECIFNFRSLYYILSLIFICFGLAIHPFFYSITLLEFVNRIQLMQTVLKAMYKPIANILITLLMFIILEYLFSLFAVSYFTYHFPNLTDTKNFLKTFMRTIDQTFKQDGGVGTYLDKSLQPEFTAYTVSSYFNIRFLFDLLFFLLILSLIFQLFLSTIIDYFNETRENDENFKEGLETNCSVCGMEREDIEKIYNNNKNSFEKHITYFHNAFNYIYYLMYLQSTSFKDAVIENGVWNLHLNKNLSYLPKNICFKQFEKKCWKKLDAKKKEIKGEED